MNNLENEKEIAMAYAQKDIGIADVVGAVPVKKQTKKKNKASERSVVSDKELIAAVKARKEGHKLFAQSKITWDEMAALETRESYARSAFASARNTAAIGQPTPSQLPRLQRELEDLLLERDDVRLKLREAQREKAVLESEKATSPDLKAAALAADALKILHDPNDFRSIPMINERLRQLELRTQTAERRVREEKMRDGPQKPFDKAAHSGRAAYGSAEDRR